MSNNNSEKKDNKLTFVEYLFASDKWYARAIGHIALSLEALGVIILSTSLILVVGALCTAFCTAILYFIWAAFHYLQLSTNCIAALAITGFIFMIGYAFVIPLIKEFKHDVLNSIRNKKWRKDNNDD